MALQTDYEAVNARGVVLATFGEIDLARAWVRQHAHQHAGLRVDIVERFEQRRVAFRPRPALATNVTPFRKVVP